jgi:hypothetical protein
MFFYTIMNLFIIFLVHVNKLPTRAVRFTLTVMAWNFMYFVWIFRVVNCCDNDFTSKLIIFSNMEFFFKAWNIRMDFRFSELR